MMGIVSHDVYIHFFCPAIIAEETVLEFLPALQNPKHLVYQRLVRHRGQQWGWCKVAGRTLSKALPGVPMASSLSSRWHTECAHIDGTLALVLRIQDLPSL